jgi:hypothetical protein
MLARAMQGTFVLRIEDTDFERSTRRPKPRFSMISGGWGSSWDEGVEAGGENGPYRQSERLHIYRAHAVELMARGHAYRCFCSSEQLDADRQQALREGRAPMYVGRCRDIAAAVARSRVESGEPAVIRFRVPAGRVVEFRGHRSRRRAVRDRGDRRPGPRPLDGVPAYNFAVVVDDALMAITHVVRGEDHISNTPRQLLLYEAFGWTPPRFAHVSLVLGPDHAPLSKRHGATSVKEFRDRGYLPEALTNYLALIGWSPGDGDELMTAPELAARFRLEQVGHSAGVVRSGEAGVGQPALSQDDRSVTSGESGDTVSAVGGLAEPAVSPRRRVPHRRDPAVAASIDRLDQVAGRLAFLFDYSAARSLERDGIRDEAIRSRPVIAALAEELMGAPLFDTEAFRAMAARVRRGPGRKGRRSSTPSGSR